MSISPVSKSDCRKGSPKNPQLPNTEAKRTTRTRSSAPFLAKSRSTSPTITKCAASASPAVMSMFVSTEG